MEETLELKDNLTPKKVHRKGKTNLQMNAFNFVRCWNCKSYNCKLCLNVLQKMSKTLNALLVKLVPALD